MTPKNTQNSENLTFFMYWYLYWHLKLHLYNRKQLIVVLWLLGVALYLLVRVGWGI